MGRKQETGLKGLRTLEIKSMKWFNHKERRDFLCGLCALVVPIVVENFEGNEDEIDTGFLFDL